MNDKLKKLLCYLMLLAIALPMASCGGDDNDNNEVPVIPNKNMFEGKTTTAPVDNPTSIYESTKSTYTVTLDDNGTAVLSIQNADFLQGMPQLGIMNFRGIKYSVDNSDAQSPVVTLSCAALTPEIGERPFPAFPITDLSATMRPGKSMTLKFICSYRTTPFNVSFKGTAAN